MDGQASIPRDKHGAPIQNGMGVPAVTPVTFLLGSAAKFVDALDLTLSKFEGEWFSHFRWDRLFRRICWIEN